MNRQKKHSIFILLTIILCIFILSCMSNNSSTADRISRPGEYAGFSDVIYDNEYEITSQYVRVSDGTKLAMDLYRPRDKETGKVIDSPLPVIWMHTPYNRRQVGNNALTVETYPGTAARLIKYGYVVATVDFRGLYASYGHNEAFNRGEWMTAARRDAYDVTEWLAEQPWSNGNIGMWGCSATGGSQMQAATTAPPHLKAVFPMSCEYDVYPFRVPGGMVAEVFQSFGASTVSLPGSDIFPALEKGTIDAADYVGPAVNWDLGFAQVTKYILFGPPGLMSIYQPVDLMEVSCNLGAWKRLSPAMQSLMEEQVKVFSSQHFLGIQKRNVDALAKFKEAGSVVNRMSADDVAMILLRRDDDSGRQRQRLVEAREHLLEGRNHEQQEHDDKNDCNFRASEGPSDCVEHALKVG